jgi:hypothetical protein
MFFRRVLDLLVVGWCNRLFFGLELLCFGDFFIMIVVVMRYGYIDSGLFFWSFEDY